MILDQLHHSLIVACEPRPLDLFNHPEHQILFAKAAVQGGAKAIRVAGLQLVQSVKAELSVPLIGCTLHYESGDIKQYTATMHEVEQLINAGVDILAIDGTFKIRESMRGPEMITEIKKRFDCPIMADISSVAEGIACEDYGADCISTSLVGWTIDSNFTRKNEPDYRIIQQLARSVTIPIFAADQISTPKMAQYSLEYGAWAVLVSQPITDPEYLTQSFVQGLTQNQIDNSSENGQE